MEAVVEMADWYLDCGEMDMNSPADTMGIILVRSVRDKARTAVEGAFMAG